MIKGYPKYPLVLIEWEDHWSEDAWESVENAVKPADKTYVRSVGWLISETDKEYRIVQNIGIDGVVSMRMVILKGTVNKFKVLRKNG